MMSSSSPVPPSPPPEAQGAHRAGRRGRGKRRHRRDRGRCRASGRRGRPRPRRPPRRRGYGDCEETKHLGWAGGAGPPPRAHSERVTSGASRAAARVTPRAGSPPPIPGHWCRPGAPLRAAAAANPFRRRRRDFRREPEAGLSCERVVE